MCRRFNPGWNHHSLKTVADRFFCIVNEGIERCSGGRIQAEPDDSKLRESRRPSRFRPQIAEGDPLRFSIPDSLNLRCLADPVGSRAGLGEARLRLRPISCFLRSLDPINPMRSDWQSQCDPAVTQCEIYALKAADLISDLETTPRQFRRNFNDKGTAETKIGT